MRRVLLLFVLLASIQLKAQQVDLNYFVGTWKVSLQSSPQTTFTWTLKPDLAGAWLSGTVHTGETKVSADYWRIKGVRIERMAFTADSMFVHLESKGWQGYTLLFAGSTTASGAQTQIRETITRIDNNTFNALWEIQQSKGVWTTLSNETCSRQPQ